MSVQEANFSASLEIQNSLIEREAQQSARRPGQALLAEVIPGWRPGDLLDLSLIDTSPLLKAPPCSALYHRTKRALDVIGAVTLLVVSAPIFLLIAILIKLDSKGPVFFRQSRLGLGLETFEFIKFRTMLTDAPTRYPAHYAYRFDPAAVRTIQFKEADDPRLTRVGRWIRRTSLDELPNLINVIKGEMSLVGPRPDIPQMLPYYRPEELCKFAVIPGVTGLAQVSGRNMLRWAETNARDVEYVHRRGTRYDLWLIGRTIVAVCGMVGAL